MHFDRFFLPSLRFPYGLTEPAMERMCSGGDEEDVATIREQGRSGLTRAMSNHCLANKIKAITALLAAGFDGGEDPFDKLATLRGMGAIG